MTTESAPVNGTLGIPPMPPPIAKAIIEVMKKVKAIARTDRNTFNNYNFASVDAFLEETRPICAEAGLDILPMEVSTAFEIGTNKKGDQEIIAVLKYQFLLMHETGATWTTDKDQRTLRLIWTGAQTSGTAQSYALKQYMRALFQIATGEPDADHDQDHGRGEPRAPAPTQRRSAPQQRSNAYADAKAKGHVAEPHANGAVAEPSEVLSNYEKALDNTHTKAGWQHVNGQHKTAVAGLDADSKKIARDLAQKALDRINDAAPAAAAE